MFSGSLFEQPAGLVAQAPLDVFFRSNVGPAPRKHGKPGDKIRRRAEAGTLTMQNPGGLVSETFRDKARERNIERMKAKGRSHV